MIVKVLFFLAIQNISWAGTAITTWQNAERSVWNAKWRVDKEVTNYHTIRSDMVTLISDWNSNQAAMKKNTTNTFSVTGGAIIGAIISLASSNPVGIVPSVYVLTVAGKRGQNSIDKTTATSKELMQAMSELLSIMDTARSNVNAAYYGGYMVSEVRPQYKDVILKRLEHTRGYDGWYDKYLEMGASHIDNYDVSTLESSVKMGKFRGYYHQDMHVGDTKSNEDHVF